MHIFALACRSKARVTTPLPILALLRPCVATLCFALAFRDVALHCHRYAILCLCGASHCNSLALQILATLSPAVANIASHAAAKPSYSLPLRGTSNLYSAVATHCIQSLCIPSIALPSLCFATQLQVMPSLHTAVEAFAVLYAATQRHCYALPHHAVAVQCLSSPLGVMPLPRDTMRFIAYPLLFDAFHRASVPFFCSHSLSMPLRHRSLPGLALALTRALRR